MISEIQTISRLLASVNVLEINTWAKEADVAEYYLTQYVFPVRDMFEESKGFCINAGLLEADGGKLRLTDLGRAYLNLGDKKTKEVILEPNQRQKEHLCRNVFLVSKILDLIKKILYHFNRGINGILSISKEKLDALDDQNFIGLLMQLDILVDKGDLVQFAPGYIELFEGVISNNFLVVTPDEFEKSQADIKELAIIAEEYVLRSEFIRLKQAGAVDQAKGIEHIAVKNVAAGYDIASFNNKDSKTHDRFIEVKAGKQTPINFYFSRNEFETAKRLRDKYYVYYVCIKNKKPQELFIFRNPPENIMKDIKFVTSIDTYEISEK